MKKIILQHRKETIKLDRETYRKMMYGKVKPNDTFRKMQDIWVEKMYQELSWLDRHMHGFFDKPSIFRIKIRQEE